VLGDIPKVTNVSQLEVMLDTHSNKILPSQLEVMLDTQTKEKIMEMETQILPVQIIVLRSEATLDIKHKEVVVSQSGILPDKLDKQIGPSR
jgi:hypothetical protein